MADLRNTMMEGGKYRGMGEKNRRRRVTTYTNPIGKDLKSFGGVDGCAEAFNE